MWTRYHTWITTSVSKLKQHTRRIILVFFSFFRRLAIKTKTSISNENINTYLRRNEFNILSLCSNRKRKKACRIPVLTLVSSHRRKRNSNRSEMFVVLFCHCIYIYKMIQNNCRWSRSKYWNANEWRTKIKLCICVYKG